MPTATIEGRPSSAVSAGKAVVNLSTERAMICVPPAWMPALSRIVLSDTPVQTAFPTSLPPISFETHERVTVSSPTPIASRSS